MADEKTISELTRELVEASLLFLRQRGRESVNYVLIEPLSKAGIKVAMILVAASMMVLGAVFLGIFMVLGFAALCGGSLMWGYLCAAILVMAMAAAVLLAMSRVGREVQSDGKSGSKSDDPGSAE